MDPISVAITLAQNIRLLIATMKGESNLVLSARQMMHSCELYENCLQELYTIIRKEEKVTKSQKFDFNNKVKDIVNQIEGDLNLLQNIYDHVQSIITSSNKRGLLTNALITIFTHRDSTLQQFESTLTSRVTMITNFMVKEIWKTSQTLNQELVNLINDIDGSIFWYAHFGNDKICSFQRFSEAFQSYITTNFYFRKFQKFHLMNLLKATLLEVPFSQENYDSKALLKSEVTIQMFALWLKRYGPMKYTITKASVVVNPSNGTMVAWMKASFDRDSAERYINNCFKSYTTIGISPESLAIVRYSSKAENDFVVSTRPPNSNIVMHLPILNTIEGYTVKSSNDSGIKYYPNLLDCLQAMVIDPLFANPLKQSISLSRDNAEQWNKIFEQASVELSGDHYADSTALDKATKEALNNSEVEYSKFSYNLLFHEDSSPTNNYVNTNKPQATMPINSTHTKEETAMIGSYLIKQGLTMLYDSGQISQITFNEISNLLKNNYI